MLTSALSYGGLFLAALAAGSILPAQSEAVLAGMLLGTEHPAVALVIVATIGNVAGSVINWLLGRGIERFRDRKWFPVSEPMLNRAEAWYHRYGRWSLLASFVPIIGDPLTVVAGLLRESLLVFVLLVTTAKLARYIVAAAVTLEFIG